MVAKLVRYGCGLVLVALMGGCFLWVKMPPGIPETGGVTLPPDKFLDLEAGTNDEKRSYTAKTGETCVKGTNDCVEHRERRTENVRVRVASGTIGGRPVSIRELAVATSPDFVRDTDRVRDLTSACRRGRVIMGVGATALAAAYFLLQVGYRGDDPNRNAAIGGWAAVGAGAVGLIGGHFVFGGQHCAAAKQIYARWEPVYEDPDATQLRGDAARMYETLADKFNRDRESTAGDQHRAEVTE